MPTVTMVISPSRTSRICCLDCAFLCILTHSDVDNTEPQEGTLCADCKKGAKLFLDCFNAVKEHKQYWNKWIVTDGWINIIDDRYDIPTNLKCIAADLNRAMGMHPKFSSIDTIGDTNVHGLYKATYFAHGGKGKSRLTAYYVTSPNTLPQKPGGNKKWYRDMVSAVPKPTNTRQNPTVKRSIPVELVPTKTKTTNESSTNSEEEKTK
jgi:hypothetical protein